MKALMVMLALALATSVMAQPVTYAWRLDCANDKTFGPYSLPEQCDAMSTTIAQTCERPIVKESRFDGKAGVWRQVDVANPNFVRIADVCKESLNGRGCACVYAAYVAEPATALPPGHRGKTLGDLVRERQQQSTP